uniref:Glycosyl transferase family 41 n=1 Tax=Candidatus Kentrum sp. DK TaxID=2126562 RepID=A0A450RXY6_9GAMM|nr:MAG: hypothetical protein BECKDK2373C_GA0170839_10074 [Candidatus Kentron sp. DK]
MDFLWEISKWLNYSPINITYKGDFSPIIDYCKSAQIFQDVPFSYPETFKYLDKAYPGSKFILTVRDDAEQWYRSIAMFHAKLLGKGYPPTTEDLRNATYVRKGFMYNTVRVYGTPDHDPYNKAIMVAHYEQHNQAILDYFKDRPCDFLAINLANKNSYQQFVKFLGVESPYGAFPWENKTSEILPFINNAEKLQDTHAIFNHIDRYGNEYLPFMNQEPTQTSNPLETSVAFRHDTNQLLAWFASGDYDSMSAHFLAGFQYFGEKVFTKLEGEQRAEVYTFVKDFLFFFIEEKYRIDGRFARDFVNCNPIIANLAAMTPMGNTDLYLQIMLDRPYEDNLGKFLTLYSPRNRVGIERSRLFDANPQLASFWYSVYFRNYTTIADSVCYENMKEHLRYDDPRIGDYFFIDDIYFGATYVDPVHDRLIKRRINQWLQRKHSHITFQSTPAGAGGKPKVAVFSDLWRERHSVYRNQSEFIASLRDDYHLTLIHMESPDTRHLDTSLFDETLYLDSPSGVLNLAPITNNGFTVAYFPDVGMTPKSILCANLPIAPIRMCGVGHSVSTFGARIDYYITGADVEPPDGVALNYSERPVLLPGYGIVHNRIAYRRRRHLPEYQPTGGERLIINCPWYSQKSNHEMLLLLDRLAREAGRALLFRFYPGGSCARLNGFIPFVRDVEKVLGGDDFIVYPSLDYDTYMGLMEEGALTIDAFPFGGCNTVADSLHLRKPTLTYQGRSWYNRIGSQMMRSIGLGELIATSPEEYIKISLRLIRDDPWRTQIALHLESMDIDNVIFDNKSSIWFKRAFDYIVANHERLKGEGGNRPLTVEDFG